MIRKLIILILLVFVLHRTWRLTQHLVDEPAPAVSPVRLTFEQEYPSQAAQLKDLRDAMTKTLDRVHQQDELIKGLKVDTVLDTSKLMGATSRMQEAEDKYRKIIGIVISENDRLMSTLNELDLRVKSMNIGVQNLEGRHKKALRQLELDKMLPADRAVAEAIESNKKVAFVFTQIECPPCRTLERDVLAQKEFLNRISDNFIVSKLDINTDQNAVRFGISRTPMVKVFNPKSNSYSAAFLPVPSINEFITQLEDAK